MTAQPQRLGRRAAAVAHGAGGIVLAARGTANLRVRAVNADEVSVGAQLDGVVDDLEGDVGDVRAADGGEGREGEEEGACVWSD